jgi:hypothetical protein
MKRKRRALRSPCVDQNEGTEVEEAGLKSKNSPRTTASPFVKKHHPPWAAGRVFDEFIARPDENRPLDIKRFVPPKQPSEDVKKLEGECRNFEFRYRNVLVNTGETLCGEPQSLESCDGFRQRVAFALVIDVLRFDILYGGEIFPVLAELFLLYNRMMAAARHESPHGKKETVYSGNPIFYGKLKSTKSTRNLTHFSRTSERPKTAWLQTPPSVQGQ